MEDLLLDSIPQRKSARVTSDPKVEEAKDSIVFLPLESADTKSRDTPGEGVALSMVGVATLLVTCTEVGGARVREKVITMYYQLTL